MKRCQETEVPATPAGVRIIQKESRKRRPGAGRPKGPDPGSYGDVLAAEVEALHETGEHEVVPPSVPEPEEQTTTAGEAADEATEEEPEATVADAEPEEPKEPAEPEEPEVPADQGAAAGEEPGRTWPSSPGVPETSSSSAGRTVTLSLPRHSGSVEQRTSTV